MITVIIPVYNTAAYLPECLDSVLNQTYRDLQIILVNDGSSDNSGAICDEYAAKDGRITVIHQKNQGVSAARNKGLELLKGEWVSFIDSDDWLEPDMYFSMLNDAEKNKADIVACDIYVEENDRQHIENIWHSHLKETEKPFSDEDKYLLGFAYVPSLWNKLISAKLIDGIEFSTQYAYGEDALFLCSAAIKADRIKALPKLLYHYRIEREGNVVSASINPRLYDHIDTYDKIAQAMLEHGAENAAAQIVYIATTHVLFKLPPNELKLTKPYRAALKQFTKKYKGVLNKLKYNTRTTFMRRCLVRISVFSPLLSVYLWNMKKRKN